MFFKIKQMIVGFTGRAGSGKDTAAKALINLNWKQLAFAKPLKDGAKALFDFTDEQLYDPKLKEVEDSRWGRSPRQILQWLGTDILRKHIDENFFLISMKSRVNFWQTRYQKNIVITDVRFDNEAELIRSLGGVIIRVSRTEGSGTEHKQHVTETGISENLVTFEVKNNGTIEELHENVLANITKL